MARPGNLAQTRVRRGAHGPSRCNFLHIYFTRYVSKCHDHLAQLIDEILIYMTMTLQVQLMVTYVRLSDVKKIEHSDSVM
jgi:hypothetical protein